MTAPGLTPIVAKLVAKPRAATPAWKGRRLARYCAFALLTLSFGKPVTVSARPQGDNPFKPRPTRPPTPPASARRPKSAPPIISSSPPAPSSPLRPFLASSINLTMVPVSINGKTLYFSRHEVTQAQWEKVMGFNPSRRKGPDLPVTNVSLDNIRLFISQLNSLENDPRVTYRLPTSEEWWLAAKLGFNRETQSWHAGNSLGTPQPAGSKAPNGYDLHDMCGNVWEWCADGFVCGGAYDSPPSDVTPEVIYPASNRPLPSNSRNYNIGFRLVASPVPKK